MSNWEYIFYWGFLRKCICKCRVRCLWASNLLHSRYSFYWLYRYWANTKKKQIKTAIRRRNIPTCEYYQFRLAAAIHIPFFCAICSFADFFRCKHNSLSLYVDYIYRFVFPSYLLVLSLLLYRVCFCDFVTLCYYCALLLNLCDEFRKFPLENLCACVCCFCCMVATMMRMTTTNFKNCYIGWYHWHN